MPSLTRRSVASASLLLALAGCSTPESRPTPSPSTALAMPSATAPPSYRYTAFQLAAVPSLQFGRYQLVWNTDFLPPNRTFTPRPDPLAGRSVEPEVCRSVIRTGGLTVPYGDFVPSDAPGALTQLELGPWVGDLQPYVQVRIIELVGASADRYIDQYTRAPAECADIRIDGTGHASVVDRSLPGFGERSRYLRRRFPVANGQWTERILYYRTPTYLVELRLTGPTATEAAFLALARQARDRIAAGLKAS
jgi:hypothetical protein